MDATRRFKTGWFTSLGIVALVAALALPPLSCGPQSLDDGMADESESGSKRKTKKSSGSSSSSSEKSTASSSSSGSSSTSRSGSSALLDDAERLLEKCRSEGLEDHDTYSDAKSRIARGERYADKGEDERAEREFKRAASDLEKLLAEGAEIARRAESARRLEKDALDARAKAEAGKANELAPVVFEEAVEALESGARSLKRSTTRSIAEAEESFKKAGELFNESMQFAEEARAMGERAVQEKDLMIAMKTRGEEKNAPDKALSRWSQAETRELDAEAAYKRGDMRQALAFYREAKDIYTSALQEVMDDAEFAKMNAENRARAEEMALKLAQEETARAAAAAQAANAGRKGNPGGNTGAGNPGGTGAGGTGAGTVPPIGAPPPVAGGRRFFGAPDCITPDIAVKFPQELDAEDESFLQENIHQLSQVASYDPSTGAILLDYTSGSNLKGEIEVINTPRNHYDFLTPDMKIAGGVDEIPESAQISFAGNTLGMVFFPVPFRYRVSVDFTFNIQTITGANYFGVITNYDKKRKSYYTTNFLDVGMSSGGAPKMKPMSGDKSGGRANYWHDKTRGVNWNVTFEMEEPDGKGGLTATYDVNNESESKNGFVTKRPKDSGYVGLRWQGVKFEMRKLRVCGFLDKAEAVRVLREKLNQPKGKGTDSPPPPDDDEGENPAAPPGDDDPIDF